MSEQGQTEARATFLAKELLEAAPFIAQGSIVRYVVDSAEHLETCAAELTSLRASQAALVEALSWYGEQAEGCRKLGSVGDPFRRALDADGGKRARAALAAQSLTAQKQEQAHRVMTREEYEAMKIVGWHEVCRDVDRAGNVGIRYLAKSQERT